MTKDELTAAIKSLNEAIVSGVRSANIDGQTVTYNTSVNLIEARDRFQAQLNGLGQRRRRTTFAVYGGRGYDR